MSDTSTVLRAMRFLLLRVEMDASYHTGKYRGIMPLLLIS
jgi:hypothetical protein